MTEMADWNTHLYCAYRVNEVLKMEGKDLDMFLYGNLLPDVNLGWLITPNVHLEHEDTHFDGLGPDFFWAPLRFCEKYPEQIKTCDPLFLGYLFHLWLDVAIMTDFASRVPMSALTGSRREVKEMKWKDMGKFIKGHEYHLSDRYLDEILERSKAIEELALTKNDLILTREYVEKAFTEYEAEEYFIYTKEELEKFYEKVCLDFIGWAERSLMWSPKTVCRG